MEHVLTPETEKHFFQEQILPPLLAGESVTIFWVPHGGMRTQMIFLVKNSALFGFDQLGKLRIVYINPYELVENSPEGYFQLMLYSLDPAHYKKDESKSAFFQLKEGVEKYCRENTHVIFILGGFEQMDFQPTFFNNLHSLWQVDKTKVHFIFACNKNILNQQPINKYDQLENLILQNIIYFPNLPQEDTEHVIERLVKKYGYKVSDSIREILIKLSGGHAGTIRSSLSLLNKTSEESEDELFKLLRDHGEIKTIFNDIWEALTEEEKITLHKIVAGDALEKVKFTDYLSKSKIVLPNGLSYSIFSPLFSYYIKGQKIEKRILSYNKETGEILIDRQPPKEKITLNEYHLLTAFLENQGKLFSRDEIAETLWGKESYEKYSDWAIDQNISLLRKKLEKLEVAPNCLQTIKGRGYRWIRQ